MLTAKLAEQILAITDAAVADLRATERWGAALDAYCMVTKGGSEVGRAGSIAPGRARFDSVTKVLVMLQERACQTSFEVHALLLIGFPGGVFGRYQALHELAVIASLISQYGRRPEHADLADPYLDYTHIDQYR